MEVKIFSVDLAGVLTQDLHKIESEINVYLSNKEFVSMEQSIISEHVTGHNRLIITVVAKKK